MQDAIIKDSFYPVGVDEEQFITEALIEGIGANSKSVMNYERTLAIKFNAEYVIATSSGYGSLVVALTSMGLKPGDKVLLTPTCPLCTVYALTFMRLRPIFCDISPNDFTIDLEMAERLIDNDTKAIIDIPMWGYPVNAKEVSQFAKSKGIYYLLDIALSHKAMLNGEYLWKYSDIATFSTHHSKTLVTGEGGAVLTDNSLLADKARKFIECDFDHISQPSLNFSLSGLQAALGLARLERFDKDVEKRLHTMSRIGKKIKNPYLQLLPVIPGGQAAGTKLLVRLLYGNNNELLKHQSKAGIPSDIALYNCKVLYQYPVMSSFVSHCPNAERMLSSITTIPVHPEINDNEINKIVTMLNSYSPNQVESL